ncbi:hypothetical protein Lal_00039122 [Lupinus albus]|nr:hypothetical protein Lal_00039122 [Lupinus albus]
MRAFQEQVALGLILELEKRVNMDDKVEDVNNESHMHVIGYIVWDIYSIRVDMNDEKYEVSKERKFGSLQHPKFKLFLYGLETYMGLEFILASISLLVRKLLGIELEPQFNKPYLSTSLQDFWGRRWNLMVNKILHPTIYKPVMNVSTRVIGRKWAPLPTIISTFAVSGLMHELVYYYVKRENTRLKRENLLGILCVFSSFMGCIWLLRLLLKKNELKGKWKLSRWVSSPLTVVFVIYTTLLLFVPTLVRYHVFEKEIKELNAIVEFGLDPYGSYFLKK